MAEFWRYHKVYGSTHTEWPSKKKQTNQWLAYTNLFLLLFCANDVFFDRDLSSADLNYGTSTDGFTSEDDVAFYFLQRRR